MTTREFADHIGVSQKTVSDAENDKRQMRKIMLNAWALGTGVPAEWLETGTTHPVDGGPGDGGQAVPSGVNKRYPQPSRLLAAA